MVSLKYSDNVTIVTLSPSSIEAGELTNLASSVDLIGHYLIDMSKLKSITQDDVMMFSRLRSQLCLYGSKLILFGTRPEVKKAFAKVGIATQFEFAADRDQALSWVEST